jgi:GT2 family glycosyltransferase
MVKIGKQKMPNKIGIILTTFLRDDLMYRIVDSIVKNWKEEYILFIGNQSYETDEEQKQGYTRFLKQLNFYCDKNIQYINLPYDCGLSYARNFLCQKAHETGCNYIFLTADSYEFKPYKLDTLMEFLESDKDNGIIGFVELNKPTPEWQWDVKLIPNDCFLLTKPIRPVIIYKDLKLQPCDIVQNFFLAKTQVILDCQWDNELKLTEHEDFFYRLKNETKYKVFFNDTIKCFYVKDKPAPYSEKRQRIYNIYKKKLQEKYHIKGWIRCQR